LTRIPQKLAAAGITLHHLHAVVPTLEDVFINLLETESVTNGN